MENGTTFFGYLNQYIDEIHGYAKEKGWWDQPRNDASVYALFHTEISEAVEEERKPAFEDRSLRAMYHNEEQTGGSIKRIPGVKMDQNGVCITKPEGTGVEIIDAVIRVLDYMGYKGYKFNKNLGGAVLGMDQMEDLTVFNEMHLVLSLAYQFNKQEDYKDEVASLESFCLMAKDYFEAHQWNFDKIFQAKKSFNTTRSKRHGGKKY